MFFCIFLRNFNVICRYFVHLIAFQRWRTRMNFFFFKKKKKAKMRLKQRKKLVLRWERKWFQFVCFRDGSQNFDREIFRFKICLVRADQPRFKITKLKGQWIKNLQSTTQETADTLNIAHSSVIHHLHQIGYVIRLNVWVPHDLKKRSNHFWKKKDHWRRKLEEKTIVEKSNSFLRSQRLIQKSTAINYTNCGKRFREKRPELANRRGIAFHHDNLRPI